MNAFFLFAADERPVVSQLNTGASGQEIGCILGKKWRELQPSEQEVYKQRAAATRAACAQKMNAFRDYEKTVRAVVTSRNPGKSEEYVTERITEMFVMLSPTEMDNLIELASSKSKGKQAPRAKPAGAAAPAKPPAKPKPPQPSTPKSNKPANGIKKQATKPKLVPKAKPKPKPTGSTAAPKAKKQTHTTTTVTTVTHTVA